MRELEDKEEREKEEQAAGTNSRASVDICMLDPSPSLLARSYSRNTHDSNFATPSKPNPKTPIQSKPIPIPVTRAGAMHPAIQLRFHTLSRFYYGDHQSMTD